MRRQKLFFLFFLLDVALHHEISQKKNHDDGPRIKIGQGSKFLFLCPSLSNNRK